MRNQKSGRGMARIRNFEPSGQDGLQTFRFLISDFSRFQEFLLELGVLLGDLLRHLPPLRFQAPGQGLVLHRQDLGGQHSSIFRAVQCYRSHRDAAGHLDCGQQGIQPIQDAIQDGVMEVTTSAARAVADYLALELTRMFLFLVSFALAQLLGLLLPYDPGIIGYLVPGIMANQFVRQGPLKTLLALTVVVGFLALLMFLAGIPVF